MKTRKFLIMLLGIGHTNSGIRAKDVGDAASAIFLGQFRLIWIKCYWALAIQTVV